MPTSYFVTAAPETYPSERHVQWASSSTRGDRDGAASATAFEVENQLHADDIDGEDVSPLEYARACGFCRNFFLDDPIKICESNPLPLVTEHDFEDHSGAISATDLSVDDLIRERLGITMDAVVVLQKVMLADDDYQPLDKLPNAPPKRNMRMELPLVLTDHETDMRNFGRSLEPDYRRLKLPMEHADIENDEALEWSQKHIQLPNMRTKDIENEKLEFPRDFIRYLQDLILDTTSEHELDTFYDQVESYQKLEKVEPITPPLLPVLSPPLAPFDPSSDTGQLPLLSDTEDSVMVEAEELDQRLQHRDHIQAPHFASSDQPNFENTDEFAQMYTPLQSDFQSDGSPALHRRTIDDLIMDAPLIPSDGSSSSSSKHRKTVSFAEQLHSIIPDLRLSRPVEQLDPESEASLEAFFNDVIEPLTREAMQAMEQEQLQAADSLQRVEVPVMDFNLLPPPWKTRSRSSGTKESSLKAQQDDWRKLSISMKMHSAQFQDYGLWKLNGKMERQLEPYPFQAELGKVPEEVGINDTRYIAAIMSDMSMKNAVASDDLVWKPEGLRIMRSTELGSDEDDQPEPLQHEEAQTEDERDIDSLVRKRRRELDLPEKNTEYRVLPAAVRLPVRSRDGQQTMPQARMTLSPPPSGGIPAMPHSDRFFNGQFATISGLSNFMDSMGQQRKKPRRDERLKSNLQASAQPTILSALGSVAAHSVTKKVAPEQVVVIPFSLPQLHSQLPPRCVILSLDLLQTYRAVLRTVFKEMYPAAGHVERDFSSVNDAPEADILLSPGTGLVFTSLQKIKQKVLPGQAAQLTGIRERIIKLAARYEFLIVLLGDAMLPDTVSVDQRDCKAIADFSAFCSNCKAEVQLHHVPAGEDNLAAWITASIYNYGDTGQDMSLLPDETMWEQTLRRCGLNAYAAQTVLASLKAGDASSSSDPLPGLTPSRTEESFGIGVFVRMSTEERITRFEGLLGGRKVLQRVSNVLEHQWLSAKTGFRQRT